jgi:hypothetical protein
MAVPEVLSVTDEGYYVSMGANDPHVCGTDWVAYLRPGGL